VTNWVDILLVTYLIYRVFLLIRGTRAWRLAFGVAAFVILLALSKVLKFDTLNYILDKAALLGPVALVILFLPELRQTLEGFGKLLPQRIGTAHSQLEAPAIEEIVASSSEMSEMKVGALMVVQREALLETVIANGTKVDAQLSAPLLGAIFYEGNPLHDGAAIIRGDRIVAAACRLPLSESLRLDPHVHMRHRAAVGITETTDCLAIVISEERGKISIAHEGKLVPLSGSDELRIYLNQILRGEEPTRLQRRKSRSAKNGQTGKSKDNSDTGLENDSYEAESSVQNEEARR